MPKQSALNRAKHEIHAALEKEARAIYSHNDIAELLHRYRRLWRLPDSITANRFLSFATDKGELNAQRVIAEKYGRSITRYVWGKASAYELALTLSPRAYFSHGTALVLHGLVAGDDRTLYLNIEQSKKPTPIGRLSQTGIDRAFKGPQRQSEMVYAIAETAVVQIAGKNTDQLGVVEIAGAGRSPIRVTNVERTLIDIVVRPAYAGGPDALVNSYRAARNRVSVDALLATLKKLDYVYPYHQAIGFLLQRTGYQSSAYAKFRSPKIKHKFYLAHAMTQPAFCEEWRIFYPRNLTV